MDYGLWLLIALLIVIGIVFLLSGKRKAEGVEEAPTEPAPVAIDPQVAAEPIVPVAAMPPLPVTPAAVIVDTPPAPVTAPPAPVAAVPAPEPVETPPAPSPVAVAEVVAPTATPEPAPVAASAADAPDDLLKLKGVGPKLKTLLLELGITSFAQIAAWTDTDIATVDAKLGNFKGRPVRDHWVDQAQYLASGDIAAFEAKYGKL